MKSSLLLDPLHNFFTLMNLFLLTTGIFRQLWQPQKNIVRTCNKIVVQKPRPRHFIRAQVEELVKPRYPRKIDPSIPVHELCQGPGQKKIIEVNVSNMKKKYNYQEFINCFLSLQENRYEELLGKDLLENVFKKHRYIFFFHRNSMTIIEELDVFLNFYLTSVKKMLYLLIQSIILQMKVLMKHCGLVMRIRPKGCVQKAFTGTIYEPTIMLFASHTFLGFGNEVDLKKMLASLRKTKLVLMGKIKISNKIFS